MSNDLINELASYIGLLVKEAGGEIRVSYASAEEGPPSGKRVKIEMDEATEEIVFHFVDANEAKPDGQ